MWDDGEALVSAARLKNWVEVKRLIDEEDCDVDEPGEFGDTALGVAVRNGDIAGLRY
eukprot:CAMPEP_0196592730 /NCGR_PEP_ID=MMETSP1081-20130531/73630_1 /TAXON_ID=36882 /ORGANISM="Pyramimonas amylifera, Strain CCMP720" /LENGTH=56 /DNA_ID=CAMNT_0041916503 /DNA_START=357 /DNA_END=527 /DNA_ORIENTATION=+